ncbi:alpha-L-fucosidase [Cohnella zeiphila]|uniref:alpha-L-fucosidase n=1 Tax=Cohnella zeiphila TaxID=2761120 RepID=A0A7X0SRL4_9BACL|nr:alpha-L-fucosidase [Cohnella zeiphila]MBB6733814.1 alpha-L-fucosidase [Cohnella zeiphila]
MEPKAYQPTQESLNAHPVPEWFQDAKFGIFIHWGPYSVPGFAPLGHFAETLKNDYDRAMLVYPYAEGYWNAMKDPATPTAQYHKAKYGDMPYQGFKRMFTEGLKNWDPSAWARVFSEAGAQYVVIVSKHHDGFCLWPTEVKNPREPNWFSERDIVGELAEAVRREGLRFGIYYSGGIDWTFRRKMSRTFMDYSFSTPGGDYPAYADAQVRELIKRYRPDILWNDICWPGGRDALFRLFAYYYEVVPDGAVNDRWKHSTSIGKLMGLKPVRAMMDAMVKRMIKKNPDIHSALAPPSIPHRDFATPEYTQYREVQAHSWEMTRGIGNSFGYNRNEREADYASFEDLLSDFADAVSKNGNLLLNVGPRGEDAQIPDEQLSRLSQFGNWLKRNGEAVYGTRPWTRAEAVTETGEAVRFTHKGDKLYLMLPGKPDGSPIRIKGLFAEGRASLLPDRSPISIERDGEDLILVFARRLDDVFMPVVVIEHESHR